MNAAVSGQIMELNSLLAPLNFLEPNLDISWRNYE